MVDLQEILDLEELSEMMDAHLIRTEGASKPFTDRRDQIESVEQIREENPRFMVQ